MAEAIQPPRPTTDEIAERFGVFDAPEGGAACLAICGMYQMMRCTREVLTKHGDRYPAGHAAAKIEELERAEAAAMMVAEGCPGGTDPTQWKSCPRSSLIQSVIVTAAEPANTLDYLHQPDEAAQRTTVDDSSQIGQYL